jgi:hypothetical protein
MTEHTPGPWHYATTGPWLLGVFVGDDFIAGVAASDNHEANARLIAAAPALLEALEVLVNNASLNNRRAARAAIAKALGEN